MNLATGSLRVSSMYRSPSTDADTFVTHLAEYLSTDTSREHVLVGDININLHSDNSEDSKNVLSEAGLVSAINAPTRVTEKTELCIDHMFVKR